MGIILIAGAVYYYEVTPRQLDLEIERIVKTAPTSTMAGDDRILSAMSATASAAHTVKQNQVAAPPITTPEPLVVIITTPDIDTSGIRKINDVIHGYGKMQKMKFSKTVREISASLTAKELAVFFNRIEPMATVSYNRQQFNSFPKTAPVPIVLKLKTAPKPAEDHLPPHAEQAAPEASVSPASPPAEQPTTPAAEVPTSSPADH